MNSLFWAFLVLNFMFPVGTPEREINIPETVTVKMMSVPIVEASVPSTLYSPERAEETLEHLEELADRAYEAIKKSLTIYQEQGRKAKAEISEDLEKSASDKKPKSKKKQGGAVECTEEEREILYRIVEAEATDGTKQQKKNVASCILARVASDEFPNTIKGVVFEKNQFTPLYDGRYYSVKITDSTKEAVDEILKNGREHDYLFFCSYGCQSSYFAKKDQKETPMKDGMHRYYLK